MRKLFATIFWIFTSLLVLINMLFLAYLLYRSFNLEFLQPLVSFILKYMPIDLAQYDLLPLWGAYLIICVPVTAILQKYGNNLGDEGVSLPLLKTIFDILGGIFKFIIVIAVLCAAIYLVKSFSGTATDGVENLKGLLDNV